MGEDIALRTRAELLAMARRAASTLQQSIADKPPETPIETNAQSLNSLAGVIDALLADTDQCGGIDCMGRATDGVKVWVTRNRLEVAETRIARYERTLQSIVGAAEPGFSDLGMLVDWQSTAQAMAHTASSALRDS